MQDLEMYPTEDLIRELMKRSPDCLVLHSYEDVERNNEIHYEYFVQGDNDWLLKRIERQVIPFLQDELEEEETEE